MTAGRHSLRIASRDRSGPLAVSSRIRTSVAGGSAMGALGAAASTVGGFLLVLVVTRSLGAAGSGGVFVAVALSTVLSNLAKLGTDTSMVRFVSRAVTRGDRDDVVGLVRTGVAAALAASLVVAALLYVLAAPVADVIYATAQAQPGARFVRLVACFLPFATLTLVLLAVTRGFGSVTSFVSVEQVLKPLSRLALVALVWLLGGGLTEVLIAWLLPILPGLAVAWASARRRVATMPASGPPLSDPGEHEAVGPREFWAFAAPRALAGALEILGPWTGVLLLSALVGSTDAGVFTAVGRVVLAGTMMIVAVRLALGPHLSAAFTRGDTEHVDALHAQSTAWSILISFPLFLSVIAFPGAVLSVFGSGFPAGSTALVVVAAANLVNVGVGNVQSVVLMGGRSSWNLFSTALALLVQVGLGVALIPAFGLVGAGIGFGAAVICHNVVSAVQAGRGIGLRVLPPVVLRAMGLTVVVFVPVLALGRSVAGGSLAVLLVCAAAASLALVAVVLRRPGILDLRSGWQVLSRGFGSTQEAS